MGPTARTVACMARVRSPHLRAALTGLAVVLLAPQAAAQTAPGDPEAGREVYARACQPCHDVDPGQHQVGPSLADVVGRPAGGAEGFRRYSRALKDSGLVWSEDNLDRFIADPDGLVPGTRKTYDGLGDSQARVDLIAYLRQLSN